jgi:hypothetical protein
MQNFMPISNLGMQVSKTLQRKYYKQKNLAKSLQNGQVKQFLDYQRI